MTICNVSLGRLPKYLWGVRIQQMWLQTRFQTSLNSLSSLSRLRKLILVLLLVLVLLYYLLPTIFHLAAPAIRTGALESCLEERIHASFKKSLEGFDAIVNHRPLRESERTYPIYVGNGKLAAAFDSQNGLFIRLNRALSLPIKFYPVVQTSVEGETVREAYVLDMKAGLAYRMQTANRGWRCVTIGSKLYAHRAHPAVLVQDIRIHNPTKTSATVELDQIGASGWAASSSQTFTVGASGESVSYTVTSGLVQIQDSKPVVAAAIGMVSIGATSINVKPGQTRILHVITVVHYTKPVAQHEADRFVPELVAQVKNDMERVLKIEEKQLQLEHTKVWTSLWKSGFGISFSKASQALNGEKINSTLYFVLSNVPAPLHDPATTMAQRVDIQRVLYYPDSCYDGHSTLQADTLWIGVEDEDEIARVVTTWMITLEKQGCAVMVQAGAEGVLQAMILSLGALRFHNSHLEMAIHPKDLHRDFFFRRINYGNNTHVNISVTVGEDNKASLYVSLDRNDKPYYACDAGCLDAPVALSNKWQRFPVKLTEPLTSILYMTADKVHMEELKHAIHVKAIEEAPPHEHHVIALHRHGHHFGGLPTLFWVSIAFLIIIFHLFLFKLIYNEYCQGQDRYTRSKYNL